MAWTVVREGLGWLGVLLSLAGCLGCAMHLGRTKWAALLAAGFGLLTVVNAFYRVATLFLARPGGAAGIEGAFAFAQLLGLGANAAIVGGVIGLLAEKARPVSAPPA
jgi:hypothetical protein